MLNVRSLGNKSTGRRARHHRRPCDRLVRRRQLAARLGRVAERRHRHTDTMLRRQTCSTANHCSQLSDQPRRSARNSLPTELRLLRSTINFHHRQKIPVDSAYIWTPGNRQTDGCFVMRPWSPSSAVSQ